MLKNQRNLLLGVPKCGSTSARVFLDGELVSEEDMHLLYKDIVGEFDNVYAFWRDPVDRFQSAIKFELYSKQSATTFQPIILEDTALTLNAREKITDFMSGKPPSQPTFKLQSEWYKNVPNLTILPFSEYETSIRFLETIFGSKGPNIPWFNKSGTFLKLDKDVEEMIKDYYKEDYNYEPKRKG
jgi:hypothetical protein